MVFEILCNSVYHIFTGISSSEHIRRLDIEFTCNKRNISEEAGENPVIVACRKADIIIGPIGIIIADSLVGEITPQMAIAVGQANAVRILLPLNKCDNLVAGVTDLSIATILEDVILKVKGIIG